MAEMDEIAIDSGRALTYPAFSALSSRGFEGFQGAGGGGCSILFIFAGCCQASNLRPDERGVRGKAQALDKANYTAQNKCSQGCVSTPVSICCQCPSIPPRRSGAGSCSRIVLPALRFLNKAQPPRMHWGNSGALEMEPSCSGEATQFFSMSTIVVQDHSNPGKRNTHLQAWGWTGCLSPPACFLSCAVPHLLPPPRTAPSAGHCQGGGRVATRGRARLLAYGLMVLPWQHCSPEREGDGET